MTIAFVVRNILASTRLFTGAVLVLFGLLGIGGGLGALIDPIGFQAANDNDPFGPPPTVLRTLLMIGLSGLVLRGALWLLFAKRWVTRPRP